MRRAPPARPAGPPPWRRGRRAAATVRPIFPYTWNYVVICAVQAVAVLVPRAPLALAWLQARPVFGLIPLAGIGGGVLLLGNVEGGPDAATDLAAVATPIAALGGVVAHRLRWLALLAPVLYVIAWQAEDTSHWAEGSANLLIIGAAATLAWLTGLIAPRGALIVGILVATAVDVYQVWAEDVQPVSRALTAAQPAADLPRLQEVVWNTASMGWGDVFLGALLGVVVATSTRLVLWVAASATFVLHLAWGLLFHWADVLPGTVPVAAALAVALAVERVRCHETPRR